MTSSLNSSPKRLSVSTRDKSNTLIEAHPSTSKEFKQPLNTIRPISALSFYNILPVPSASPTNKRSVSRAKQHSQILTESPLKEQLEEQAKKKKEKAEKGNKKENAEKGKKPKVMLKKKKGFKKNLRKLLQSDSEEEDIDERTLCQDDDLDDMENEDNNEICLICDEYGKGGELWYRCTVCGHWVHELCSGWDTAENYKCDICLRK